MYVSSSLSCVIRNVTLLAAYQQPILYNLAVARELAKQIYVAERLQPPNLATVRTAYSLIFSRAVSPAYWREAVQSGDILRIGIYGLEAYGIYKVRAFRNYYVVICPNQVLCEDWRDNWSSESDWLQYSLDSPRHWQSQNYFLDGRFSSIVKARGMNISIGQLCLSNLSDRRRSLGQNPVVRLNAPGFPFFYKQNALTRPDELSVTRRCFPNGNSHVPLWNDTSSLDRCLVFLLWLHQFLHSSSTMAGLSQQ
jgi:hypothetical protein